MKLKENLDTLIKQKNEVRYLIDTNGSGDINIFNKRHELLKELYNSLQEEIIQLSKLYFKSIKK